MFLPVLFLADTPPTVTMGRNQGLPMEPSRGGARGGADQFKWDDVRAMSDNEKNHYLGASVMALSGRWTQNKDVYWWTRGRDNPQDMAEELALVKQEEQRMLAEALGGTLPPSSDPGPSGVAGAEAVAVAP